MKCILVDDDNALLEQAKIFLENSGNDIEITAINSAMQALDILEEDNYDAVISDYQMPEIDGLEFLRKLREERDSDIPFIMFTGKGREEVAIEALNLGADRYLQKGGDPGTQYSVLGQAIKQEVTHHRTEKNYKTIVENSNDAIYIYKDYKLLFANEQASKVTGYSEEELTKMSVWALIHPEDQGKIKSLEENRIRGHDVPDKYDIRIITKNREVRHLQLSVSSIVYRGDQALLGSARDITEKKRNERELKESKNWLDQVIEGSSVSLFVIDDEHKVTHWNKSCENLTGFAKEDMVGTKNAGHAFYDEERPVLADLVLDGASESEIKKWYGEKLRESSILKDAYEVEDFFPNMGNKGVWVFFTAVPLKDSKGNNIGAIETLQDITERKSTEELLKKSEERYRRLFETAQDGMLIIDAETGLIKDANPYLQDILGYSKEEFIGKELWELGTFKSIIENKKKFKKLIEEGYIRYEDKPLVTKEGEEVPVEFVSNTYEAGGKKVVQCNIREISERKRTEEALKNLTRSVLKSTDQDLFDSIVEGLYQWFDVHAVCVGEIKDDGLNVSSLSMILDGEWIDDYEYELFGTPCENVTRRGPCLYKENVREMFPEDEELKEMKIEGYIGIPIMDDMNETIGVIWAVSRNKLKNIPKNWEELLDVLAISASAEIRRLKEERKKERMKKFFVYTIDSLTANIAILDENGDIIEVNQAWKEFADLEGSEWDDYGVGQNYLNIVKDLQGFNSEDTWRCKEGIKEVINGERERFETEYPCHSPDKNRWFIMNINRFEFGGKVNVVIAHTDITERKKAEIELEKGKKRFETLFRDNPLGVVEVDEDFRIVRANARFESLFGFEEDELIGQHIDDLIVPEDRLEESEEINNKGKEKGYFDHETVRLNKYGEKIEVSLTGRPIVYEGKKHYLGVYKDIRERKRAEEKRKDTENKLKKLHEVVTKIVRQGTEDEICKTAVDAASDILEFSRCNIGLIDPDGKLRVKYASHEISPDDYMEGYPKDVGIAGKTFLECESHLIRNIQENEDAMPQKGDYKSALSVPIPGKGVFQAISLEEGYFDETDLELAELLISHVFEALERIRAKEDEEFLHSLLRHDVGNKARIIQGYIDLADENDLPKEAREFVSKAKKETENAIEIIDKVRTLRDLSMEEEIGDIDLDFLLNNIIDDYRPAFDEKDIKIEYINKRIKIRGGTLLEELFSNLLENAVTHSSCDNIKISVKESEDEVLVKVEDDGKGVPDDIKKRLFERGFKKGEGSGSGLGLYLVKKIAEGYGGNVKVEDSDMGGIRFDVKLRKL